MSLFKDLLVFLSSTDLSKDRDDTSNKFLWNSSNLGFSFINSSRPLTPGNNQATKNNNELLLVGVYQHFEEHNA
jgi:hypothetical protein